VPWTTTPTAVTAVGTPAAVVRPHRCPECACATREGYGSDDGELSLQDTPVLCIPLSTPSRCTSRVSTDPYDQYALWPWGRRACCG
jgi:hypothetical protein